MRNKYLRIACLALPVFIAVGVVLQLRVNRNMSLLKNEISTPASPIHSGETSETALQNAHEILITNVETQPKAFDYLFFRRQVEIKYKAHSTRMHREISHFKTRQRTGKDFVDVPRQLITAHTANATVGPFGYTLK